MNPVLEKVLEGLRNTSMTVDVHWDGSEVSSPCLLSPALSGISEVSHGFYSSITFL